MSVMGAAAIVAGGSLLGGAMGASSQISANNANRDMAYDFAKNGISWKVDDAKNAGISPMAALGIQTSSPSAVMQSSSSGQALANASQNIGKAMMRKKGLPDQMKNYAEQKLHLDVAKDEAQVAILQQEANNLRGTAGDPPPMPSNTAVIPVGVDKNPSSAYKIVDYPDGTSAVVPSEDMADLVSDDFAAKTKHYMSVATMDSKTQARLIKAKGLPPKGYRWEMNRIGTIYPVKLTTTQKAKISKFKLNYGGRD
ncbi:DNA pilot protein [Microviridae sp.]|nr:DNA pilot protein [Microviridae sp.]